MFSKDKLLDAALRVAKRQHYSQMTRAQVAQEAGCADGVVSYYLGSMAQVRSAVVKAARVAGILPKVQSAPVAAKRNSGRNGPVRS